MSDAGHLDGLRLDALVLEGLDLEAAGGHEPHLANCEDCRQELSLRLEHARTFDADVFGRTAPLVRERLERPPRAWCRRAPSMRRVAALEVCQVTGRSCGLLSSVQSVNSWSAVPRIV